MFIVLLLKRGLSSAALVLETELGVEDALAETDRLGSYLNKLVIVDKLDSFLKAEDNGGSKQKLFVRARRADSGELFLLTGIYCDILIFGVLANYHTLVNGSLRTYEEVSALLSIVETVSRGLTRLGCNERACKSHNYLSAIGLITVEYGVHNALAVSSGEKFGAVTEQTS